eukprot:6191578-Pleurochrysis_carterae.AAC.1
MSGAYSGSHVTSTSSIIHDDQIGGSGGGVGGACPRCHIEGICLCVTTKCLKYEMSDESHVLDAFNKLA